MPSLDVSSILIDAGVEILSVGTKEITGRCPMHKERVGKDDRHASWSMNKHTFVHHCFSCGYSGTLSGLLIDVQGYAPDDIETEIRAASFLNTMAKVGRAVLPERVEPPITEWVLANKMADMPQRLLDRRRLARSAVETFGVRWDPDSRVWVLPIRTPEGDLMGAQLRQKGTVINNPTGMEKSVTLFGLDIASRARETQVALVESPLDAIRLHGLGIPAVASFGAWVSPRQIELLARHFHTVVIALDNDPAGQQSVPFVRKGLQRRSTFAPSFSYEGLTTEDGRPAKDPGDVYSDQRLVSAWKMSLGLSLA